MECPVCGNTGRLCGKPNYCPRPKLPPVPKFDATDAVLRTLAELDALASVDADDFITELERQGFIVTPGTYG